VNKNQVEGTAKDVAGKIQRKVGEVTGSAEQQVKGAGKQMEGKIQKGVGNVQQAQEDADKDAQANIRAERDRRP
jgi:uncharacterized protein YjbJ (UPF0337 family)